MVLAAPETIAAQKLFLDQRRNGGRVLAGTVATHHVSTSGAYRVKHSECFGGEVKEFDLLGGKKVAESSDSEWR